MHLCPDDMHVDAYLHTHCLKQSSTGQKRALFRKVCVDEHRHRPLPFAHRPIRPENPVQNEP